MSSPGGAFRHAQDQHVAREAEAGAPGRLFARKPARGARLGVRRGLRESDAPDAAAREAGRLRDRDRHEPFRAGLRRNRREGAGDGRALDRRRLRGSRIGRQRQGDHPYRRGVLPSRGSAVLARGRQQSPPAAWLEPAGVVCGPGGHDGEERLRAIGEAELAQSAGIRSFSSRGRAWAPERHGATQQAPSRPAFPRRGSWTRVGKQLFYDDGSVEPASLLCGRLRDVFDQGSPEQPWKRLCKALIQPYLRSQQISLSIEDGLKLLFVPGWLYFPYKVAKEQRRCEPELSILRDIVPKNRMAIDVGSNRGIYSYALS